MNDTDTSYMHCIYIWYDMYTIHLQDRKNHPLKNRDAPLYLYNARRCLVFVIEKCAAFFSRKCYVLAARTRVKVIREISSIQSQIISLKYSLVT